MIDQIRPADLQKWLGSSTGQNPPIVLDVREPSEVRLASVRADGFDLVLIPMGVLVPRLAELDPERPIACLCHHGGRSMQVASYLQRQGFTKLANIAGGIHAWAAELDPSIPQY